MNKSELVAEFSKNANIPENIASNFLTLFNDIVIEKLKENDKVTVVGFGTLSASERKEIQAKNVKTLEPIKVNSIVVPKFKGGKEFLSKLPKEKFE